MVHNGHGVRYNVISPHTASERMLRVVDAEKRGRSIISATALRAAGIVKNVRLTRLTRAHGEAIAVARDVSAEK